MKNTFKLLGIVALAAVIGFSLFSCSSSSGGGTSGTYSAIVFKLDTSDYTTIFGLPVPSSGQFMILSGTFESLAAKVALAETTASSFDELVGGDGISYSDIDKTIQQELVNPGIITASQKNQLLNELKSKGYGVAATYLGSGEIGVAAAYKE